ncbi:NUDIX domain-containing protein [Candidatus Shapirobacteria bacterium]|nr:NUDIX domain-containing protein [Candidatus Shapirobacteria bacterium]
MEQKIHEDLYYDERSAGGIVYKTEDKKIKWLIVKTLGNRFSKNGRQSGHIVYKFPKGHLAKNEVLKQAALREVEEEGQVKSKIVTKIGSNDYIIWDKLEKRKIIKKVTFFLMEYEADSPLRHFDKEMVLERYWLEFDEAMGKLAYDSEKILLKKAKVKLDETLKQANSMR